MKKRAIGYPYVSVIMSVYNAEKYLKLSMDSVFNQTFRDFEFIIVDDGSTDKSLDIINDYRDSRIRLFINKKNSGLVFSLNKGIEEAKGKYVARMDADDISLPERFMKQVDYMETHPEVDVCGAFIQTFDDTKGIREKCRIYPEKDTEIKGKMIFECAFAHPVVMLRRQILLEKKLRYDAAFIHAEDYDLWSRMMDCCIFHNIPEVLLQYRVNHASVSTLNSDRQVEKTEQIRKRNMKRFLLPSPIIDLFFLKRKITALEFDAAIGALNLMKYMNGLYEWYDSYWFDESLREFKFRFVRKNCHMGTRALRAFSFKEYRMKPFYIHFVKHCLLGK